VKLGPARKYAAVFVAGILVGQLFFVRELVASLVVFSAAFAVLSVLGLVVLLVEDTGQRGLAWLGSHVQAATEFPGPRLERAVASRGSGPEPVRENQ
jgi:hypothetical protein